MARDLGLGWVRGLRTCHRNTRTLPRRPNPLRARFGIAFLLVLFVGIWINEIAIVVNLIEVERLDLKSPDYERLPLCFGHLLRKICPLDYVIRVDEDRVG